MIGAPNPKVREAMEEEHCHVLRVLLGFVCSLVQVCLGDTQEFVDDCRCPHWRPVEQPASRFQVRVMAMVPETGDFITRKRPLWCWVIFSCDVLEIDLRGQTHTRGGVWEGV